ncbi:MAG: carbohydrate kinase family protein [Gammaproteobacteria bacterium]|nr:carbohydrate kinase family protein [Gammaproteobacteria bacterium]
MNLTNKGLIKGRDYVPGETPFVTVIGGANIDIHGRSNGKLRHKDSNPGTVHTSAGGVARNIAENLTRLGVDSRLISAVGDDHHGQMLVQLSREAGIDVQNVHEIAGARTSTYLSVLDETGDMLVGINDMSIIDRLTVELLKPQQAMISESALIIVDANLPDDTLAWLTHTFATATIFADTVSSTKAPRLQPYLPSIHTLKTGTIEIEALTGMEAQSDAQLRKLAGWLHGQGVKRVYVTRGGRSIFYSTGNAQGFKDLPGTKREVHNAGGAGDAFLAGLAYAWLQSWPLDESLRFALATADVTLSHPDTSSPALSMSAVNRVMESRRAE